MRRSSTEALAIVGLALLLGACAGTPSREAAPSAEQRELAAAVAALEQGRAAQAEAAFVSLSDETGRAAPALNLALLARDRGELDTALQWAELATAAEDAGAREWTLVGLLRRHRGELRAAETSYRQALRLDPSYAPAHRNLGILYELYLGEPRAALEHYRAFLDAGGDAEPVTTWIRILDRQVSAR
jgi:tetratricopeptide (TPR) repeat protein